jgi:hypothetical protein
MCAFANQVTRVKKMKKRGQAQRGWPAVLFFTPETWWGQEWLGGWGLQ